MNMPLISLGRSLATQSWRICSGSRRVGSVIYKPGAVCGGRGRYLARPSLRPRGLQHSNPWSPNSIFVLFVSPDATWPRSPGGFTRFTGRRLRPRGASSIKVREKADSIPANVAPQLVKAGKFHFRNGLGSVRQAWQRLRPVRREIAQITTITGCLVRSRPTRTNLQVTGACQQSLGEKAGRDRTIRLDVPSVKSRPRESSAEPQRP